MSVVVLRQAVFVWGGLSDIVKIITFLAHTLVNHSNPNIMASRAYLIHFYLEGYKNNVILLLLMK